MARTVMTPKDVTRAGVTYALAAVDAVNGNYFTNNGRCALHVNNASAGSINVTITTPTTVDGNAVADLVVAVGAGVEKIIGVFPPTLYNTDGEVYVDWSSGTSVTAAVIRF